MSRPVGYSYVRFSSKPQGKGSSLARQTQDTVAGESPATWCAKNGVTLDAALTFHDLGRSAFKGEKQAELLAFLEHVKTGRIRPGSFLLVERVDRITRKGVDEGLDIIKRILKAGVSIVTLANGRVYGPDAVKGLMKGLLELQMHLEQAQQFSETLSGRVAVAWEEKRKKAREGGTLATAAMPPWLAPVGEGDDRRTVPVPEKVATVHRIFEMAGAGCGLTRILKTLADETAPTPALTRGGTWSRTTLRRILTDRSVLGEYQPMRGRGRARVPDGPVIEGYYPAVVTPATFHRARSCMGSRKKGKVGRDSKLMNVFSGLLKDARTGASYITNLRIEKGNRRHHVLLSATKTGASNSFPFRVFEEAVLSLLREVNPRDVLPPAAGGDEVLALAGEAEAVGAEIAAIAAEMDREYSATLAGVLRRKEERQKELVSRLDEAKLRAASPLTEAWGEAKTLLAAVADAPDPDAARLRLRAVLRRVVESVWLLPVGRGRDRLCAVQVWFTGDVCRSYLILHRPPKSNGRAAVPGGCRVCSLASDVVPGKLDLRKPADARALEADLLRQDARQLWAAMEPPGPVG